VLQSQARVGVALASAAVVLAAVWVWAPSSGDEPEGSVPVWGEAADEIVEITLSDPAFGAATLTREGDVWTVDAGGARFSADRWRVGDVVRELESARAGMPVAAAGADTSAFGFAGATVRTRDQDGVVVEVAVGGKAPGGWRQYLRLADGAVVAVDARFERILVDPDSLRDPRLLDIPAADVVGLRLTAPEGTLDVSVDADGMWWLEGFGRANPDAVDDFVMGLAAVRAERFEALEVEPERSVVVRLRDGASLQLDAGAAGAEGVPVRVGSGVTAWVAAPALALLGQGPTDLADPLAFPLPEEGPLSLTLSIDGATTTVARAPGWTLNGAPSADAAGLTSRLSSVPARYRREPVPTADGSIGSLSVEAGARAWSWSIGPEVEPGLWAVADSRGGASYMVPVAHVREALLSARGGLPPAGAAE
jgi:hypothetical protein